MTQIVLEFRQDQNSSPSYTLVVDVCSSPFGAKWVGLLEEELKSRRLHLEKHFSFLGWLSPPRDMRSLTAQLKDSLQKICSLREFPDIAGLQSVDREQLNKIHHNFEKLTGQIWDQSGLYNRLSATDRYHINSVNELVHEMEYFFESEKQAQNGRRITPRLNFSSLPREPRILLEESDYDKFALELPFGAMVLKYCQLGKSHLQAWQDNDIDIEEKNINSLRYYSRDFCIDFHERKAPPVEFYDWLRKREIKVENFQNKFVDNLGRLHGIGELHIGSLRTDQSPEAIISALQSHKDLFAISIQKNGHTSARAEFSYRWDDLSYERRQTYAYIGFRS